MLAEFFISLILALVVIVLIVIAKKAAFKKRPSSPTEQMYIQSYVDNLIKDLDESYKKEMEKQKEHFRLQMQDWKAKYEKKIRADAIKRHKNTIKGKTTEHLAPFMDNFDYNPSDCRFLGSPIDIVVFDGLSDGEVKNVVFLEIKTGKNASLSRRERQVRDAIEAKKVSWELLRKDG